MQKKGYDIVQGRCVIRNNGSFWNMMIAVEFELIYMIYHRGGGILRNYGIFGGSNGFWKYEALSETGFDKNMLTEDINSSYEALLNGFKIGYCDDVISYELCPITFSAWVSQRLRWSQGWLQVTLRHTCRAMRSKNFGIWQKIMTLAYLPFREINTYLSGQILPAFIIYLVFVGRLEINTNFLIISLVLKDLVSWITVISAYFHNKYDAGRMTDIEYKPVGAYGHIIYAILSPFYLLLLLLISMVSHYKQLIGTKKWVITPR